MHVGHVPISALIMWLYIISILSSERRLARSHHRALGSLLGDADKTGCGMEGQTLQWWTRRNCLHGLVPCTSTLDVWLLALANDLHASLHLHLAQHLRPRLCLSSESLLKGGQTQTWFSVCKWDDLVFSLFASCFTTVSYCLTSPKAICLFFASANRDLEVIIKSFELGFGSFFNVYYIIKRPTVLTKKTYILTLLKLHKPKCIFFCVFVSRF